jgi:hypothetical protein
MSGGAEGLLFSHKKAQKTEEGFAQKVAINRQRREIRKPGQESANGAKYEARGKQAPTARNMKARGKQAPKARNMKARGKREAQRNASPLVTGELRKREH